MAPSLKPETLEELHRRIPELTPDVAELASQLFQSGGSLSQLWEADYTHIPATIEEFLNDPDLMGVAGKSLYPFWKEELYDLYAPWSSYRQWICTGSIGGGKTTAAILALLYKVYLLTEMRNPQEFAGLMQGTPIVFGLFSATVNLSEADEYRILTGLMGTSPYFRAVSGVKMEGSRRASEILNLPHHIQFAFGSRAIHALGMNLMGGLMDEANFGDVQSGHQQMIELFNEVWRRMESRYESAPSPGIMIIVSSKKAESEFTQQHVQKWQEGQEGTLKVTTFALYDVVKERYKSGLQFRVMVGDDAVPSRILDQVQFRGRVPEKVTQGHEEIPAGFNIIDVPAELYTTYNLDVEGALRDISAIVVGGEKPLIGLRQKLMDCIDPNRQHPFDAQTLIMNLGDPTQEIGPHFKYDLLTIKKINRWVPKIRPSAPRFVHIDIGLNNDALGISMLHLSGFKPGIAEDPTGEMAFLDIPTIWVDFMLQIKCSPGSEVDLAKVRRFILELRTRWNFPVAYVSLDRFQSADMIQLFKKAGIDSGVMSVDINDDAYIALAHSVLQLNMSYYEYPIFLKEARYLKHDRVKHKVDHLAIFPDGSGIPGSKDVADSVAGALLSCLKNELSYQLPSMGPIGEQAQDPTPTPASFAWILGRYSKQVKADKEFFRKPVQSILGKPEI